MKLTKLSLLAVCAGTMPAFSAITILTENFSNSNDPVATDVPVTGWVVSSNSTFLLESGDPEDALGADGLADGYASLNGDVTANGASFSPSADLSLGTLDLGDVGGTITVNLDFLEVSSGANVNAIILVGGTNVAADNGTTFGASPNFGSMTVNYDVLPGDVGDEVFLRFNFFSSSDARIIGVDRLDVNFAPVPEPGSVILLGLGLPLLCLRRRA